MERARKGKDSFLPFQIFAIVESLGFSSCLHGIVEIFIGAEVHQLSPKAQAGSPFAGAAVEINAAHAAGIGGFRIDIADPADLRAVGKACHAPCLGRVFRRGTSGTHAFPSPNKGIRGSIHHLAAIAQAFPKGNGARTAGAALI